MNCIFSWRFKMRPHFFLGGITLKHWQKIRGFILQWWGANDTRWQVNRELVEVPRCAWRPMHSKGKALLGGKGKRKGMPDLIHKCWGWEILYFFIIFLWFCSFTVVGWTKAWSLGESGFAFGAKKGMGEEISNPESWQNLQFKNSE